MLGIRAISHPMTPWPWRREHRDPDVDATPVHRLETTRDDAEGQPAADAGIQAPPRLQIPHVASLQLRHGEEVVGVMQVEIMGRLPGEFEAAEPAVTLAQRQRGRRQAF